MYGEGISKTGELIDLGVAANLIEKSGSWFSYKDQRIGQGRGNAKQFMRDNPEIAAEVEHALRQNAGLFDDVMLEASPDGGGDDTANDGAAANAPAATASTVTAPTVTPSDGD